MRELNLDNGDILEGKVDIKEVPAGTYLMKQDSHKVGSITVAHSLRPVSCEVNNITDGMGLQCFPHLIAIYLFF